MLNSMIFREFGDRRLFIKPGPLPKPGTRSFFDCMTTDAALAIEGVLFMEGEKLQYKPSSVEWDKEGCVAFKGTVLSENQVVGSDGLRPDLVNVIDNTIYIIDVTVPFENRRSAFQQAKQRKIEKYTSLIPYFAIRGFSRVQIVPIVVGSLGPWHPENDIFFKKVATNSYLRLLRKLCVSDCIRWSRDIYIQHLTGVQQYSTDAADVQPDPEATEENESDKNVNSSDVNSISQTENNVNSPDPSGQSVVLIPYEDLSGMGDPTGRLDYRWLSSQGCQSTQASPARQAKNTTNGEGL
ncbi:retrovirus-related Pol polyprotein from type-1 retrotransposable element R2 [Trichonephila clavipes]|nr:retrovirus-related Pol polyprotein from type-1 retrotransposable element R2 [Trichonephila clavipes]